MTTIPERIRENVARAIYEAHPWGDEDAGTNKWELLGLEWQDAYLKMADAALDAANPLLLAAEKRGREEERERISQEAARLSAGFSIEAQNPSKTSVEADLMRVHAAAFSDFSQLIRSTN